MNTRHAPRWAPFVGSAKIRFRHLGDPSPLPSPLSSSFKSSEPTPQPISHPCLLFLSLPHVPLALLVPQPYAYIILLSLQVPRANSPTYFPSLPLVSLFATCASSSASAPTLCLHHPDPCHLPSSQIPLPIFPTIPGGQEVFVPENMALS